MTEETGLRERKKQRTRQALSDTAVELFLKRGFDQVSVADVAAAVEVSKPTLFRYFPAKEDLALYRIADHQGEAARVVTGRPAGRSPLAALRTHFHERLDAHDPVTGLNDNATVRAFNDMLYTTPSLLARLIRYADRDEELLAEALAAAGGGRRADGGAGGRADHHGPPAPRPGELAQAGRGAADRRCAAGGAPRRGPGVRLAGGGAGDGVRPLGAPAPRPFPGDPAYSCGSTPARRSPYA
ncbi:hypothetical protein GCM10020000_23530 [Streptomyces olivoverticillatus]